jgi:hypothetical protein
MKDEAAWIEVSGFGVYDVLSELEHLVRDFDLGDVVKVFVRILELVGGSVVTFPSDPSPMVVEA